MRILLLCSGFNGLTQRVATELGSDGHQVSWEVVNTAESMDQAAAAAGPDLILCPFLRERVPESVWRRYLTIIIHPGPPGDRGPSSLDWAITEGATQWGVTAIQAVEEMDAGPPWATRMFPMPAGEPARKSSLYSGPVTDAAVELAREVVAKASVDGVVTITARPAHLGRFRPVMTQRTRAFRWSDPTDQILRTIRAADGSPGVRTILAGLEVSVFDAHRGSSDLDAALVDADPGAADPGAADPGAADPGTAGPGGCGAIAAYRNGAVLVRTGDGAVWIGHVRTRTPHAAPVKTTAVAALGDRIADVAELPEPLLGRRGTPDWSGYREIGYDRVGEVGVVTMDFYNGAMSTAQCRRLRTVLRHAAEQDTAVLVLQGGEIFSNGIHLGAIETSPHPELEAWHNINAIDDVCLEIITCTRQLVLTALGGNAGAGGVMLGLGADEVLARGGVVLNPHYKTMGLFGSEYWTYALPKRVGTDKAQELTEQCLPIGAQQAAAIGLVDAVLPGDLATFDQAVLDRARALASSAAYPSLLATKERDRLTQERDQPLADHRQIELAHMATDIFEDRRGFRELRQRFITKQRRPLAEVSTPRAAAAALQHMPA